MRRDKTEKLFLGPVGAKAFNQKNIGNYKNLITNDVNDSTDSAPEAHVHTLLAEHTPLTHRHPQPRGLAAVEREIRQS